MGEQSSEDIEDKEEVMQEEVGDTKPSKDVLAPQSQITEVNSSQRKELLVLLCSCESTYYSNA